LARPVKADSNDWYDTIEVTKAEDFYVQIHFRNDADPKLKLNAEDCIATVALPSDVGKKIDVSGIVASSNAKPLKVWDEVSFVSEKKDFRITYIQGTARLTNKKAPPEGFTLPDALLSEEGALLGYEEMDGVIGSGDEYEGTVIFQVHVDPTGKGVGILNSKGFQIGLTILLGCVVVLMVFILFRKSNRKKGGAYL
jgi:hypothetical protein